MNDAFQFVVNETLRREAFPVCRSQIYFAHAGVTALPKVVADAMIDYVRRSSENHQEFGTVLEEVKTARKIAADFIGARPDEVALLGPTSLGLSLFANGLPWKSGDDVICYAGDYPANVYPWINLRRIGVNVRSLEPARLGEITPELVERSLRPETRLVALATANFFTGYRIDVDTIGRLLRDRGILFAVDGIQTLGAFPLSVEYVDFLSADAHKWMLGPLAIGIVYVKKEHFELLRPTLLGAWNVVSPNFIAQEDIVFVNTARRYEPGVLNIPGIMGLVAALRLLTNVGVDRIAERLMQLKARLVSSLGPHGFEFIAPTDGPNASGITTCSHPRIDATRFLPALEKNNIVILLRHNRAGVAFLRFSPHFYNTEAEVDRIAEVLGAEVRSITRSADVVGGDRDRQSRPDKALR